MSTYNRGRLLREIKAGKVTMVAAYSYDDMYGSERVTTEMPVAMAPETWQERKEGVCYIREHELKNKSGCAYTDKSGRVNLIVHSNSSYTLRVN